MVFSSGDLDVIPSKSARRKRQSLLHRGPVDLARMRVDDQTRLGHEVGPDRRAIEHDLNRERERLGRWSGAGDSNRERDSWTSGDVAAPCPASTSSSWRISPRPGAATHSLELASALAADLDESGIAPKLGHDVQ